MRKLLLGIQEIEASEHLPLSPNFSACTAITAKRLLKIDGPPGSSDGAGPGNRDYWPMRPKRNDVRQISTCIRRSTLKLRGTGAPSQEIKIFAGKFPASAVAFLDLMRHSIRPAPLPSRGSHYRFLGIPLAVSAVSGIVPV